MKVPGSKRGGTCLLLWNAQATVHAQWRTAYGVLYCCCSDAVRDSMFCLNARHRIACGEHVRGTYQIIHYRRECTWNWAGRARWVLQLETAKKAWIGAEFERAPPTR